jgi:flavin-binding protein dodecin
VFGGRAGGGSPWQTASTRSSSSSERASQSLRDLRIAEVSELDVQIENGAVSAYRAKVKVSFKYEGGD